MYRRVTLLVAALILLSASALPAQDALLAQMYGSGVHAYFSHDYYQAHEYLTSAIEGGSKDPRPHYFRGMVCMRLGRPADAEIDFRSGAEKESLDIHRFYDVSKSLERVQGRARMTLERYRVKARMAARQRAEKLQKARYDQIRKDEGRLLQQQAGQVPLAPTGLPIEATPEPAEASPFEEDPEGEADTLPAPRSAIEPTVQPAVEPTVEPTVEPGAGPAIEPQMPTEPDPFSDEGPAEPVAPPAVGPSPGPGGGGEKSGGLFGALRRSLSKAVGGGAEPPGGAPFGPGPAGLPVEPQAEPPGDALDDDPFADAPGADEAPSMEPAAEPVTEPAAEPAGAPAPGPADDDPFADPAEPAEPAEPTGGNESEVNLEDPFAE